MTATRRGSFDHTSRTEVADAVAGHDVVVNCAAWTDVDGAELHEPEVVVANQLLPDALARAVGSEGGRFVHLSTDYVFDGTHSAPYPEDAPMNPMSAYGRSKAAGEDLVRTALPDGHLIVRTAWLYGTHGPCFPKTILRLSTESDHLSVVDDQIGQPTWTMDVADLIVRLVIGKVPTGTYHATSAGSCSWYEFARAVLRAAGVDPEKVSPVPTSAIPRRAPRPVNSTLGHDALLRHGIAPIDDWRARWQQAASKVLSLP